MRNLLWALLIGLSPISVPILARRRAARLGLPGDRQGAAEDDARRRAEDRPGSDKSYTRKEINDLFNPPDWYPDMHPPMPQVVAHGKAPKVRACGACHLPTGTGHDESAYVAALPAGYSVGR